MQTYCVNLLKAPNEINCIDCVCWMNGEMDVGSMAIPCCHEYNVHCSDKRKRENKPKLMVFFPIGGNRGSNWWNPFQRRRPSWELHIERGRDVVKQRYDQGGRMVGSNASHTERQAIGTHAATSRFRTQSHIHRDNDYGRTVHFAEKIQIGRNNRWTR